MYFARYFFLDFIELIIEELMSSNIRGWVNEQ